MFSGRQQTTEHRTIIEHHADVSRWLAIVAAAAAAAAAGDTESAAQS